MYHELAYEEISCHGSSKWAAILLRDVIMLKAMQHSQLTVSAVTACLGKWILHLYSSVGVTVNSHLQVPLAGYLQVVYT